MERGRSWVRRARPWLLLSAALVLVPVLALAACGGEGDGGDSTPTALPSPALEASPTPGDGASPTPQGSPTPAAAGTGTPVAPPAEAGITLEEFRIIPDRTRAEAGGVVFRVRNEGTLRHQLVVIRSDLRIAEMPVTDDGIVDEEEVEVVGKLPPIAPGRELELTLNLEAGSYVLICNLKDGDKGHYLSGMYNAFAVQD